MDLAKIKVTSIVQQYMRLFPVHYEAVKKHVAIERAAQKDKWATPGRDSVLERKYGTYPEDIHNQILHKLSPEEYTWYQSANGQKWFYTKFKEFRITEKI